MVLGESFSLDGSLNQLESGSNDIDRFSESYHQLVRKKTKTIRRLKLLIIVVILLVASLIGWGAYTLAERQHRAVFHQHFEDEALHVADHLFINTANKLWIALTLSLFFGSNSAPQHSSQWQDLFLDQYSLLSIGNLYSGNVKSVTFSPVNQANKTEPWETGSQIEDPIIIFRALVAGASSESQVQVRQADPHHELSRANQAAFKEAIQSRRPTISKVIWEDGIPLNAIFAPALQEDTGEVVGVVTVQSEVDTFFGEQVFRGHKSLTAVMDNECGDTLSFSLESGNSTSLRKQEDILFHSCVSDRSLQGIYSTFLSGIPNKAMREKYQDVLFPSKSPNTEASDNFLGCPFSIHVYPMKEFEKSSHTMQTTAYPITVVLFFVFTVILFLAYDLLVERRQRVLMDSAQQSSAIVHSLFPSVVRDRLLVRSNSDSRNARSSATRTQPHVLDNEPIAEHFTDCTIMFADIAGFTAWSSEREPRQVFELLEALYFEFDKLANQLGVFKVETIGDCYVAVVGLPEPNRQHALVMTRFARQIQSKMNLLVKKLEASLGPGTSDLTLRIGLHSGSTTAGVLRGDKSRFQLFGDTMNTAARMESTGLPNCIQVSEKTADLIIAAGRKHWLEPREDPVFAKGKGQLKTYMIQPQEKRPSYPLSASTGALPTRRRASPIPPRLQLHKAFSMENIHRDTSKTDRLVDWMSEVLQSLLVKLIVTRQNINAESDKTQDHTISMKQEPRRIVSFQEPRRIGSFSKQRRIGSFQQPTRSNHEQPTGDGLQKTKLDDEVQNELNQYVSEIANLYNNDLPFHNFEHASHVALSANKFLKRIEIETCKSVSAHAIRSNPLVQFVLVFAALVQDVDYSGPASLHDSVSFQTESKVDRGSLDIALGLLHQPRFAKLYEAICPTTDDSSRFQQSLASILRATTSFDQGHSNDLKQDAYVWKTDPTVVLEYLLQASHVSHTMQHWLIYDKWNDRLFKEEYLAFQRGLSSRDPSRDWYEDQLCYFDNVVIPLATRLKDVLNDDETFEMFAKQNRKEWQQKGAQVILEACQLQRQSSFRRYLRRTSAAA